MTQEQITINLPTQPEAQAAEVTRGEAWATELVVADTDTRQKAGQGLIAFKRMRKNIADLFAESKKAAHAAHKAVCAAEETLAAPVEAAIKVVMAKALAYDAEQERMRREAERKAREIADAERRRMDANAAKCRDEAKKEAWAAAAAAVEVAPVTIAQPVKVEGESRRATWKAELADMRELCRAAASGDANAMSVLAFNQAAANRLAAVHKRDGVIPGVAFKEEVTLAHRA